MSASTSALEVSRRANIQVPGGNRKVWLAAYANHSRVPTTTTHNSA